MDSFTVELVSNASGELFPKNTLSSFTNFLPEQVNLEGQWEVATSEISYTFLYQNITEGNFKFSDEKCSKSTSTYNLEPGLYTCITDIVEDMNTLIQEGNNHNETCITVKVSRRTQKVVIMLVIIRLAVLWFSMVCLSSGTLLEKVTMVLFSLTPLRTFHSKFASGRGSFAIIIVK